MYEIDVENAPRFVREKGWVAPEDQLCVTRLSGGVSNEVLYVRVLDRPEGSFVLKQARPQLRTRDPWFCSVERIWREVDVLRICSRLLEADAGSPPHGQKPAELSARTPRILFEDRENYAFAMTAAPQDHQVWKQQLLTGQVDQDIADQCGRLLGTLHARSWGDAEIARTLADRRMFDDLRLDPYYRTVARNKEFRDAAPHLERLIRSVWEHPRSLVHADFSPKNLLVYEGGLMMVDFETGHYGDPAFDLGFFLSHLALKALCKAGRYKLDAPASASCGADALAGASSLYSTGHERYLALIRRFWRSYREVVAPAIGESEYRALVARGIQNFAGCSWARIDGKSKVEYLPDEPRRQAVRQWCQWIFHQQPSEWSDIETHLEAQMSRLASPA
jgi:5-methylthioribose kinase